MSLRRLRSGELLAAAGAVCVIVAMLLRWYESPAGALDAWDTFGPTIVLLLIAAIVALALLLSTLTERSTALPIALAVWCFPLGLIAIVSALVRVLERPDHATSLCVGPWLALVGAVAIFAGGWQALHDERPSLYRPATPEPRPRP